MALRSSRKFILNVTCRPPQLCSSLLRICTGARLCTDNCNILQPSRPGVQAVISCYQKKEPFLRVDADRALEQHKDDSGDLYRLVLSVRPDEFHKLPPKCSACGAIFQTKHDTQIGYIKEKKFLDSFKRGTLNKLACYNCYCLRYHNSPVIQGVNSNDAMAQLQHLPQRTALILYVVDLFDIEGTMLPNILELVGRKKRIIIVGNKIDRFPLDTEKPDQKPNQQILAMEDALKDMCFKNGLEGCNFRDICLVSARTGFGLTMLLKIIRKHRSQTDVYLVGCTNTGKSTLYNLLVNMLNVHKSDDLPAQALAHHLPGTTRSLLRESINNLEADRMERRLKKGPEEAKAFDYDDELLDLLGVKKTSKRYQHMGMAAYASDQRDQRRQKLLGQEMKAMEQRPVEIVEEKSRAEDEKFSFIYDTPGILKSSQIIQYLTPSEINSLSPTLWVVPRTFRMKPGGCLFIGGLARLDYLSITRSFLERNEQEDCGYEQPREVRPPGQPIFVTAMISPNVPIHTTVMETADEKFEKLFSNNVLELPKGTPERFKEFPKLKECQYAIVGRSRNINAADLALHGVGWLSVAAIQGAAVKLALHTPNGLGQSLRSKPLLPYTVRKKEGRGVKYRGSINVNMYGHTRKRSCQLAPLQRDDPVYLWGNKIKEKMKLEILQRKEDERLERIEQGILHQREKALKEKEEKLRLLDEHNYLKLLEGGK